MEQFQFSQLVTESKKINRRLKKIEQSLQLFILLKCFDRADMIESVKYPFESQPAVSAIFREELLLKIKELVSELKI